MLFPCFAGLFRHRFLDVFLEVFFSRFFRFVEFFGPKMVQRNAYVRAPWEHLKSIPAPNSIFGCILVTLWLPFGSLWLPLAPFRFPFGSLWLPFGSLFGFLLLPLGTISHHFHNFGSLSAHLCIHFTHFGRSACKVSSEIMFLGTRVRESPAHGRLHPDRALAPSFPKSPEWNFAAGNLDPLRARRRSGRVSMRRAFPYLHALYLSTSPSTFPSAFL